MSHFSCARNINTHSDSLSFPFRERNRMFSHISDISQREKHKRTFCFALHFFQRAHHNVISHLTLGHRRGNIHACTHAHEHVHTHTHTRKLYSLPHSLITPPPPLPSPSPSLSPRERERETPSFFAMHTHK